MLDYWSPRGASVFFMQHVKPEFERPILRMGAIAFFAGIIIVIASSILHSPGPQPDLMDNPAIFTVYAEHDLWIAAHIGQLAGILLIYAGGYVALHTFFSRSESGVASALATLGLAAAIMTAATFGILQAVDGIALKMAVDKWHAAPAGSEEKAIYFGVAEGIRWTEGGVQSIYRILQGAVAMIFGTAILKSGVFHKGIGILGIISGTFAITTGVIVAYVLFSSVRDPVADTETVITFVWLIVLGIFMWKRSMKKKELSTSK
jgi:uncharacterized protein DUF4386